MYLRELHKFGFVFLCVSEKLRATFGEYLGATSFCVSSDEFDVSGLQPLVIFTESL